MTDSVTFWAQPNEATGYGLAPARHGRIIVVSKLLALGCIVGTILIVRHVAALDWDQYSAWDWWARRQLASIILMGLVLLFGAVVLIYAVVWGVRGMIRDRAVTQRSGTNPSPRTRKAALTLSSIGFKHWAARPTRALVPWSDVGHWTATRRAISITLAGRHLDGQVVHIPFTDIDADRRQITAEFERFSGRPPIG